MLYYLSELSDWAANQGISNDLLKALNVFSYITFRAICAGITAFLISVIFGNFVIRKLISLKFGQPIRTAAEVHKLHELHGSKKGTPTMGGFIILLSLIIPTVLFAKITNVYIVLLLLSAVWLGAVGFLDDYIKVFKKNKEGLSGKFKIVGQIGLGLIVGLTMYYNEHIKVRVYSKLTMLADGTQVQSYTDSKSLMTTVPFLKNNQFDYNMLLPSFIPDHYVWVVYVLVVIFIITAVSNGANITDGLDGLAAGTSVIIGLTLAILAYVSGNKVFSQYLNVMFIPNSGELAIFCAAFVGACIGFLWYNTYPAQVFMGDTGSLMLGGVIATLAIVIRKEMLIPVLCGIFLIENLSVIIQVGYFKYTKKKYGEGLRIFLMSPLHHHYQKKGFHEAKIVTRFWIIGIILAILTVITLKLR
jgi:phospho-N-acetylmuramoyl-pentapeptide-transferase